GFPRAVLCICQYELYPLIRPVPTEVKVLPRRAGGKAIFRDDSAKLLDIFLEFKCRSGSQADGHCIREELFQYRYDALIARSEIVPPFGNTMRLIECNERHIKSPDQIPELFVVETLRGNVEELVVSALKVCHQ